MNAIKRVLFAEIGAIGAPYALNIDVLLSFIQEIGQRIYYINRSYLTLGNLFSATLADEGRGLRRPFQGGADLLGKMRKPERGRIDPSPDTAIKAGETRCTT